MNTPTPSEIKAMSQRYSTPRTIKNWTVVHCGKQVFEGTAGLCQWFITHNGLKGATKKPIYERAK